MFVSSQLEKSSRLHGKGRFTKLLQNTVLPFRMVNVRKYLSHTFELDEQQLRESC